MPEEKAIKVKKKRWVSIVAPKLFGGDVLGESYVVNPSSLVDRTLTINLMALTNDVKRQNTNIKFLVTGLEGDRAVTDIISYFMVPSSIKRMVRKGRVRADMSFICFTADNKRIRVKPFLLITTSTKGSAAAALRKEAVDILIKEIGKMSYEDLIKNLIMHKIQRGLRDHLKKIYPLRACEIKELSIEKEKKPVEKAKKAEGKEIKVKVEKRKELKKEEKPKEEKKAEVKREEPEKEEIKVEKK